MKQKVDGEGGAAAGGKEVKGLRLVLVNKQGGWSRVPSKTRRAVKKGCLPKKKKGL